MFAEKVIPNGFADAQEFSVVCTLSFSKDMKPASDRSSHQMCSIRKTIRNCAKFTEKTCDRVFFLLEKETLVQVFSCEFCESSKNTFFTEHFWVTASEMNCYVCLSF